MELDGQTADELRSELDRLPSMPTGDTSPHESVVSARGEYFAARSALDRHHKSRRPAPPAIDSGGLDASQIRQLADELILEEPPIDPQIEGRIARGRERLERLGEAALAQSSDETKRIPLVLRPIVLLVRMILAPLRALLATARQNADQAARIRMLEERQRVEEELRDAEARLGNDRYRIEEVRQRRSDAEDRAARHGLAVEPEKLGRLAREVERADQASRDLERWEQQEERYMRSLRDVESLLREALRERGVADVSSLSDALARYEEECAERGQAAREASRRPDLRRAYGERRRAESLAKDSERLRCEAGEGLRAAEEVIGVTGDSDDEVVALLLDWRRNYREDLKGFDVALGEWNELQNLLGGGTLGNWNKTRSVVAAKQSSPLLAWSLQT